MEDLLVLLQSGSQPLLQVLDAALCLCVSLGSRLGSMLQRNLSTVQPVLQGLHDLRLLGCLLLRSSLRL